MDEYPKDKLEARRKKFKSKVKDAIEERKETTRNRIIGGYCILGFIIFCLILIILRYIIGQYVGI